MWQWVVGSGDASGEWDVGCGIGIGGAKPYQVEPPAPNALALALAPSLAFKLHFIWLAILYIDMQTSLFAAAAQGA